MFTIDEARNTRPAVTRQIPHGATLEYSQADVQRALEEQDRAGEHKRARFLNRQIDWVAQTIARTVSKFASVSKSTVATGRSGS